MAPLERGAQASSQDLPGRVLCREGRGEGGEALMADTPISGVPGFDHAVGHPSDLCVGQKHLSRGLKFLSGVADTMTKVLFKSNSLQTENCSPRTQENVVEVRGIALWLSRIRVGIRLLDCLGISVWKIPPPDGCTTHISTASEQHGCSQRRTHHSCGV